VIADARVGCAFVAADNRTNQSRAAGSCDGWDSVLLGCRPGERRTSASDKSWRSTCCMRTSGMSHRRSFRCPARQGSPPRKLR